MSKQERLRRLRGWKVVAAVAAFSLPMSAMTVPVEGINSSAVAKAQSVNNTGIKGVVTTGTDWENPVVPYPMPQEYIDNYSGMEQYSAYLSRAEVEDLFDGINFSGIDINGSIEEVSSSQRDLSSIELHEVSGDIYSLPSSYPYNDTEGDPIVINNAGNTFTIKHGKVYNGISFELASEDNSFFMKRVSPGVFEPISNEEWEVLSANNGEVLKQQLEADTIQEFFVNQESGEGSNSAGILTYPGMFFSAEVLAGDKDTEPAMQSYGNVFAFSKDPALNTVENSIWFDLHSPAGIFDAGVGESYKVSKNREKIEIPFGTYFRNNTNGSGDENYDTLSSISVSEFIVEPSEAEFTSTYSNLNIPAGTQSSTYLDNGTLPGDGTEFEFKNPDTVPDWVTLHGDSTITANPDRAVEPGTYPVTVNVYTPEGKVKDFVVNLEVGEPIPNPELPDIITVPGEPASEPIGDVPENSTCESDPSNPDWVTVDSEDCTVIADPPEDTDPGDYPINVIVTPPEGDPQTVPGKVTVKEKEISSYPDINVAAGQSETSTPVGDSSDVQFSFDRSQENSAPDWVTVDPNTGVVTANPPAEEPTSNNTYDVTVTNPSTGVSYLVPVAVNVTNFTAPSYEDITVYSGQEKTSSPEGGTGNNPYYELEGDHPEWVSIENLTGQISAHPPLDTPTENGISVTVRYYPEGQSEQDLYRDVQMFVNTLNDEVSTSYGNVTVKGGETQTQDPGGSFPDGSTFATEDGTPDWITVDPDTGVVTANPPVGTETGSNTYNIVVTTPGGREETVTIQVEVTEDPVEASYTPTTLRQGESETKGLEGTFPDGTTFSKGVDVPSWIEVDSSTGELTISPTLSTPVGEGTYNIVAQTPAGKSSYVPASVTVKEVELRGSYDPISITTGESGTSTPSSNAPTGSTYELGDGAPDWAEIDPETGIVTLTPPEGTEPGNVDVPVHVTTPEGQEQDWTVSVTVVEPGVEASYDNISVNTGDTQTQEIQGTYPSGSTFSKGDNMPGWVEVNLNTGEVTATPPAGTDLGSNTYNVHVTTPGGQNVDVPVQIEVTEVPVSGSYEDISVPGGGSSTGDFTGTTPPGSTFEPGPGTPDWITVDPNTGEITVDPPADTNPGEVDVVVVVTTPGGSTKDVPAKVTVTEAPVDGSYDDVSTPAGTPSAQPIKGVIPPGSSYELPEGTPDWITVDPDTGEITVNPPKDVDPGDYPVNVHITTPEGQEKDILVNITVTEPPVEGSYGDISTPAGAPKDMTITGDNPTGSTYTIPGDSQDWISVDPDTGTITVNPPRDTEPGDYPVTVHVTTPEGQEKDIPVNITVTEPDFEGSYNDVFVPAGGSGSVEFDGNAPSGSTYTLPDNTPDWITINPDTGEISVNPPKDVDLGTINLLVNVTTPKNNSKDIPINITVTEVTLDASYPPLTVPGGGEGSVPVEGDIPENSTCELKDGATSWVSVDEDCTLIANPPAGTDPGDYDVVVVITTPGGQESEVPGVIKVGETPIDATYPDIDVPAGGTDTSTPSGHIPDGSTFTPGDGTEDWVEVDPNTGVVTVNPPRDTEPGDYEVEITITTPGGQNETITVPIKVRTDKSIADTGVNDMGKPVIIMNYPGDDPVKFVVDTPAGADSISVDGGVITITWTDSDKEDTTLDLNSDISVSVEGNGNDRVIVVDNGNGDVVRIPVVDAHVEDISKDSDGNYLITMNDGETSWTINVGDDIDDMVSAVKKDMVNHGYTNVAEEVLTEEIRELLKSKDDAFKEELEKIDNDLSNLFDKTGNDLTNLEQCISSPHVVIPSVIASIAGILALAPIVRIPGMEGMTRQMDPFGNNPQVQQIKKFAYENRHLAAAGFGALGIIGLLLLPGLCNSGTLTESSSTSEE